MWLDELDTLKRKVKTNRWGEKKGEKMKEREDAKIWKGAEAAQTTFT